MDAACDLDRLFLFEHARQASEAIYSKKPHDADNLTRRGGALLELSRFQNGQFHKNMLEMLSQVWRTPLRSILEDMMHGAWGMHIPPMPFLHLIVM